MSSSDDKASTARRRDSEATREALLRAAREVFDEHGYERATTRGIGERAGVDPALIARYFTNKEGLFLAAISSMGDEEDPLLGPAEVVAMLLERWERRGPSPVSRALASPRLSDDVRLTVRQLVRDRLLRGQAGEMRARGVPDAELRAELLVAIAVGVAITRANGTLESLASAPLGEVLGVLGPLLDEFGREPGAAG